MRTVQVRTAPAYEVRIGSGLLRQCGTQILQVHGPCLAALVTDTTVERLYAPAVTASLERAGFRVVRFVIPAGEQSKNLENYGALLSFLAEQGVTRSDLIVALGGGVPGDLAGFAAATYLRGMEFVQIATTLLAQVDSSVGGKTAVDLPQGKNMAGAFWQPSLVLCDVSCLGTLSPEALSDGMAETIKYGMIADAGILDALEQGDLERDPEDVIARCIQIKADVVEADERDRGPRQLLNFGHTGGHAMEKASGYTLTHGHAVAMGMMLVTRACVRQGRIPRDMAERLERILRTWNLPADPVLDARALAEGALSDKKRRGETITLVLPSEPGKCVLEQVKTSELEAFFQSGMP